jgi:hypothetical protein
VSTFEAIVVAILLALVLRAMLAAIGGGWAERRDARILSLAIPVAAAWAAITHRERATPEAEIEGRPIAVHEAGFVSSDACQTCHPWQYETWHRSYHRTMTQVVTPHTVLADFDDVTLTLDGASYHLTTDGEAFWVETDDPGHEGATPPKRVKRRVVLSTGSHHEQDYWLEVPGSDRRLELFPFSHNRREGRWVPFRSVFLSPPGSRSAGGPGLWNGVCIDCHTTRPIPRIQLRDEEDRSYDSRVTEFGIACEACHGPGGRHVSQNHNPLRRVTSYVKDGTDESIVNPARLSHERSSQVCGACHGIFVKKDSVGVEKDERGFKLLDGFGPDPYVPGRDIDESRVYIQPRFFDPDLETTDRERHRMIQRQLREGFDVEGYFWSDGMVRISGREYSGMIESPCYERGELACTSCHRLHEAADDPRPISEWADDQLARGMESNRACVSCHADFENAKALVAHTHHPAGSNGSQCYNCHMPYTVYGIQKAIRSHHIDSPSVAVTVATGRPNACNQCHLDKSLGWAAARLNAWYEIPAPKLSWQQRQIAAGALWAVQARAGERALVAWSMGWAPAMEASGADWMTPILATLLVDPYDSVRFLASRSLRKRPGFEDFAFDFVVPGHEQGAALARTLEIWGERPVVRRDASSLLQKPDGSFDVARAQALVRGRDNRPLTLHE